MNIITEIRIWNDTVGFASWDERLNCAVFRYDPSFLGKGYDLSPLTMPLIDRPFRFEGLNRETYQGLPGMLSDSLPDKFGNSLIDVWLSMNKMPAYDFTPLDKLCYVGKRGMGALEYEPSVKDKSRISKIDVDLLASLASNITEERGNLHTDLNETGLQELIQVGTSAGGARPKAVIGLNEKTMEICSGQFDLPPGYEHWILKFDTESRDGRRGYCRIEYAYHNIAKECGIDMEECRLLETSKGSAHFMTKRFDRVGNEKVHMQTLCSLAHFDYMMPGRYSYEDVFAAMRRMHIPYIDQKQMFKRMVFNVIMRNQDDHTKNFSFLYGKDKKWRVSPAYDITYAFDPDNFWMRRHQMSINGKTENIDRTDMKEFAHNMNIDKADDIIDRTISAANKWQYFAKEAGVPKDVADLIDEKLLKDL